MRTKEKNIQLTEQHEMINICQDKETVLNTKVYDNFKELLPMQQEWDAFVKSVGCEIFLTYDWCRVWWKYYGAKRKLRVFIFRYRGSLVGIIPMFFEKIWLGPFCLGVGKIVGTDFSIIAVSLPLRREFIPAIVGTLFNDVLTHFQWDVINFGPIAGMYDDFNELEKVCRKSLRDSHLIRNKNAAVQTYFELADSWENQLASLSKNERGNIRRNYNAVRRASQDKLGSLVSFFVSRDNFADSFEEFVEMHQSHWQKMGQLGHFEDWPCAREFHRELAETQLMHGRLRLLKVEFNNKCLGYQYHYSFGNKFTHFLDARLGSLSLTSLSLGRITFCELIKKALQENIRCIDSLRSRYEYKMRLGGKLFPIRNLYIVPNKLATVIRVSIFQGLARLLNLSYYRIWFSRIAPKLPLKRRALWKIWIRSHMFT